MLINPVIQTYTAIDPLVAKPSPGQSSVLHSDIRLANKIDNTDVEQDSTFHLRSSSSLNLTDISSDENPSNQLPFGEQSTVNDKNKSDQEKTIEQEKEDALIIRQLKARYQGERIHEAVEGEKYAESLNLQFTRSSDGFISATGGEISIGTNRVTDTPQVTIEKARVVQTASFIPMSSAIQDRVTLSQVGLLESDALAGLRDALEKEQEKEEKALEEGKTETLTLSDNKESIGREDDANTTASKTNDTQGNKEDDSADGDTVNDSISGEVVTAKDRLEEILLASKPIAIELNELGLIDTEHPFGKSEFIRLLV